MAQPQAKQDYVLEIRRTFNTTRETVFRAWTDPQALSAWFAPSDAMTTPVVEIDLRVGGAYRIEMQEPDGKRHCVAGVYREVKEPERLVFTWSGTGCTAEPLDTLVTVELFARGTQTEMVLTHEGFSNAQDRDAHDQGWTGCLAQLAKHL
ncbi:MAG: SRPBCC domain-containing protein [Pseudomonadota bacterium]|nr:MAG: SRPBCC domain-containing protein [Pseudomonadota bacterium]